MSESQKSIDRTGENHPMSKKVFLYKFDKETQEMILDKSFNTSTDAAKFFKCSTRTISNYLNKNKLYKKQWILTSSDSNATQDIVLLVK